jgi:alpha-aminoadipate carrier protein LysW
LNLYELDWASSLTTTRITMSECPVCGAKLALSDDLVKGELLECDDCGTELEVIGLAPVVLKEAPEAEEDWGQ